MTSTALARALDGSAPGGLSRDALVAARPTGWPPALADPDTREGAAGALQEAASTGRDFVLPPLAGWNTQPCRAHRAEVVDGVLTPRTAPVPGCQHCGVVLRKHQRVGAGWLYWRPRALLADTMGSGKTFTVAGMIALARQGGELGPPDDPSQRGVGAAPRVLVVCRAVAVPQWAAQLVRVLPDLAVIALTGTPGARTAALSGRWEVAVVGAEMLRGRGGGTGGGKSSRGGTEAERIRRHFALAAVVADDVDPLRHPGTATARAIRSLAATAPRFVVASGTPLQKRLGELYAVLEPLGGREVFGSPAAFERRYVRSERVTIYLPSGPNRGRRREISQVVGYKNVGEFARLARPMVLRRTARDLDDVEMPAVSVSTVWVPLHPAQRAKYEELQQGVIALQRSSGPALTRAQALAKVHYGAQICAGLGTLAADPARDVPGVDGNGAGSNAANATSAKLDWLVAQLTQGDLSEEKVVVFAYHRPTVRILAARLASAGVGAVTISGDDMRPAARSAAVERFWSDPTCRVLVGTSAIEQSLNLQVARYLVCLDQVMNAARMEQVAGRIRRQGSAHSTVFVVNVLTPGTQEERYLPALEREAGLSGAVWGEETEMFASLDPVALALLVTG